MQNEKKQEQVRTVGTVMILTLLGKVLGLLRDMLQARKFATGMAANAFMAASRIPRNFFDAIFASSISASFIPVFNEYYEKRGKEEAFRLSNAFITVVMLTTAGASVLGILFARPLTGLLASGFDEPTAALCASLLKILFPSILCTGVAFSFVGILQSLGEFNIPSLLSFASNSLIVIYYLFFSERFGIIGLAVAFLLGWALQALMQLPSLHRLGYHYRPTLRHDGLRKIWLLMLPVLVSTWVQPINLIVATNYASYLNGGAAASAMEYANTLYTIIAGVFVLSVANVVFPELSRLSVREEKETFGESLSDTVNTLFLFLIPMGVGLSVLARPLIRLLYEWGAWGQESTELTAGALTYLSLGMIGYGAQIILTRAYYAEQKGKMPLIAGIFSVLINLALCALLSPLLGIRGLAIASAVSLLLPAALLLFSLSRSYPALLQKSAVADFLKMVLCAAVMGLAAAFVSRWIEGTLADGVLTRALAACLPVLVGAVVYFAGVTLCRVKVMKQAKDVAVSLLKRGK